MYQQPSDAKKAARERLKRDTELFLAAGGHIPEIPQGVTGEPKLMSKGGKMVYVSNQNVQTVKERVMAVMNEKRSRSNG